MRHKRKRNSISAGFITFIKWGVFLLVTYFLFKKGQAAALAERGYYSTGGEYIILVFPIIIVYLYSLTKKSKKK